MSIALLAAISVAMAADTASTKPSLSAAEIVNRNVTARGGLATWRAVQTMLMEGKLGAGGNRRETLQVPLPTKQTGKLPVPARPTEEVELPFTMTMQRPRKVRFELKFNGQNAVQVYDGVNGWKLRPFLNRRDVETFSPEELKTASMQPDIDGPLVDYAAKGTQIELAGVEKVEDRDAYKIKLTPKSVQSFNIWIDAQTFLETKVEGQPRRLDGKYRQVEIYYRDYRSINGLQIPFVLETKVLPLEGPAPRLRQPDVPAEKITIEKVVVNPKLEASLFTKPATEITTARQ